MEVGVLEEKIGGSVDFREVEQDSVGWTCMARELTEGPVVGGINVKWEEFGMQYKAYLSDGLLFSFFVDQVRECLTCSVAALACFHINSSCHS